MRKPEPFSIFVPPTKDGIFGRMSRRLPTEKPKPVRAIPFSINIERAGQSVVYTEIYSLRGRRIKIVVKSDPYRNQCKANAYVWQEADLAWSVVATIPSGGTVVNTGMYVWKDHEIAAAHGQFESERSRLKKEAHYILGLK